MAWHGMAALTGGRRRRLGYMTEGGRKGEGYVCCAMLGCVYYVPLLLLLLSSWRAILPPSHPCSSRKKNNKENSKIVWIFRLIYCLTFNREFWRVASYRTHFLRHTFPSLFGTPPPPCLSSSSHGGREGGREKSESSSAAICLFPEKKLSKKLPSFFPDCEILFADKRFLPLSFEEERGLFFFFAYSFSLTSAKKNFRREKQRGGGMFFSCSPPWLIWSVIIIISPPPPSFATSCRWVFNDPGSRERKEDDDEDTAFDK